jgi:PKD repeat protein
MADSTTYLWHFGDGATSTDENPLHIYTAPGTYTVSLTVNSLYDATKISYVQANSSIRTVRFTNAGRGYPDKIYMDFGDGTYATSLPADHDYDLNVVGEPYMVNTGLIVSRKDQSASTTRVIDLLSLAENEYH